MSYNMGPTDPKVRGKDVADSQLRKQSPAFDDPQPTTAERPRQAAASRSTCGGFMLGSGN
jgi:hypothetical protein